MQHLSRYVLRIATLILALTFIFSGFVKVADPWGGAIKIEEYLRVYSIDWMAPISMFLSIALSCGELIMGMLLLFRVHLKRLSQLYLIAMLIFTAISVASTTILPIGDCGCFGEAIKLTAEQTLYKNIILLLISIWLFFDYRNKPPHKSLRNNLALYFVIMFCVTLALHTLQSMPIIDFTAYKVGTNLRGELFESRVVATTKTTLIYRNISSGELREFAIEDMEWRDADVWEWVETRNEVIDNREYIYDFKLYNSNQEDITRNLLEFDGSTTLFIIRDITSLSSDCIAWIVDESTKGAERGDKIFLINAHRSTLPDELSTLESVTLDYTTLKTLLRPSNGAVTISDGVISEKRRCK